MAKPLMVTFGEKTISFNPSRLDRAKVHGARKRIPLDRNGNQCTRASLTADGSQLLTSGMTAQGYFSTDGRWIAHSEMIGLDSSGMVVEPKPSTLGVPQSVSGPVDPVEILSLEVESIFNLELEEDSNYLVEKLKSGLIYKCLFNYVAGFEVGTAYLVANDAGIFAHIGKSTIK